MRQRNGKALVNLPAFAHRVSCERTLLKVLGNHDARGPIMLASAGTGWALGAALKTVLGNVPVTLKRSSQMLLRQVCGPARLYLDGDGVVRYLEERLDEQVAHGIEKAMATIWDDETGKTFSQHSDPALRNGFTIVELPIIEEGVIVPADATGISSSSSAGAKMNAGCTRLVSSSAVSWLAAVTVLVAAMF